MRKVILFIASSLDSFIAREDGAIDWLFHDADYNYKKFFMSIDTVMMGRKTYELSKTLAEDPYPDKKIIVFSRNKTPEPGIEISDEPVSAVERLKEEDGLNIWLVGGSEIIDILMKHNLVDELILSVHPILLGKGMPLFKGIQEKKMDLIKTQEFGSGLVQLHYVFRN